jgi:hypothetical protein
MRDEYYTGVQAEERQMKLRTKLTAYWGIAAGVGGIAAYALMLMMRSQGAPQESILPFFFIACLLPAGIGLRMGSKMAWYGMTGFFAVTGIWASVGVVANACGPSSGG